MGKIMPKLPNWIVPLVILIVVALVAFFWAASDFPSIDRALFGDEGFPVRIPDDIFSRSDSVALKSVLTSLNAAISALLFITYVRIYRETKMKFSIGLMVFSFSMFVHTIVSNPLVFFRAHRVIGIPVLFEQFFAFVALLSLLYITLRY